MCSTLKTIHIPLVICQARLSKSKHFGLKQQKKNNRINDKGVRGKDRETKCANFYISNWITSTWLVILAQWQAMCQILNSNSMKIYLQHTNDQRLYSLLLFILSMTWLPYIGFRCFNIFLNVSTPTRFRIFDKTKENLNQLSRCWSQTIDGFLFKAQSFMSFICNTWNGQDIVFDLRRQVISTTSILISDENNSTEEGGGEGEI